MSASNILDTSTVNFQDLVGNGRSYTVLHLWRSDFVEA